MAAFTVRSSASISRAEALESINQLVAVIAAAHWGALWARRELPVPLERFRHRPLGFRHVQPVTPVMLTDFFRLEREQFLAGPA
jgi:hypothetical protein